MHKRKYCLNKSREIEKVNFSVAMLVALTVTSYTQNSNQEKKQIT